MTKGDEYTADDDAKIIKICSTELRTMTPLLKFDAVQAGDVLLSRGRNLAPHVIAKLSGGKYSHAALWVLPMVHPSRAGSAPELVEADDLGVGVTPLRHLFLHLNRRELETVARLPGDVDAAVLLRHPRIKSLTDTALENATSEFRAGEFFRSYPSFHRLIGASSLPGVVKPLLRLPLSALYATTKEAVAPGSFCSELVAKFFRQLGLSVFDYEIEPERVSPNHFVRPGSCLCSVPEAFVNVSDLQDESYATMSSDPVVQKIEESVSRQVFLPYMVTMKSAGVRARQVIAHANTLAAQWRQARKERRQVPNSTDLQIEASFLNPLPGETPSYRRISDSLFVTSILARHLDLALAELEDDQAIETHLPRFYAVLSLRQTHSVLRCQLQCDLHRHRTLYTLQLGRAYPGELKKRDRRKLIQDWQEVKRLNRSAYETNSEMFKEHELFNEIVQGEEAQSHIRSILNDVEIAAAGEIRDRF
jgi:hypothetical protein